MQLNTYFEIEQITLNSGDVIYKVFGYTKKPSRVMKFLKWAYPDEYSKDNYSFEDALEQIELLSSKIPKERRIVHTTNYVFTESKKYEKIKQ